MRFGVVLLLLLLLFGAVANVCGQSDRKTLVELYTDNQGLYFPAGRTLYAIVFENGRIDFMDTSHHDLVMRHSHLSQGQVQQVRRIVAAEDFHQFQGVVFAQNQDRFRDYQSNLEVTVHSPSGARSFTLQGFEPENGKPFPQAVNRFLCVIDDLKKVEYRLSSGCN